MMSGMNVSWSGVGIIINATPLGDSKEGETTVENHKYDVKWTLHAECCSQAYKHMPLAQKQNKKQTSTEM